MRIGINVINSNDQLRGPDRYAIELIYHLGLIDHSNTYYIFHAPWQTYIETMFLPFDNIHLVKLQIPRNRVYRALWQSVLFQRKAARYSPDIIHYMNLIPFLGKKFGVVTTVHGVEEYIDAENSSKFVSGIKKLIARLAIQKSDILVAVSEYSREITLNMFNVDTRKCWVILEGVNANSFIAKNCRNIKDKYDLPDNYILCVGAVEKRKNMITIVRAFAGLDYKLRDTFRIVIAGKKGDAYDDLIRTAGGLNINDRIHFIGQVPHNELGCIYKYAAAFTFPSLIESFGLPVLEAMACGVPVISSNTGALPEVCGDAAILADPSDMDAWKTSLQKVLASDEDRQKLIQKGRERINTLTWKRTAEQILEIYGAVAQNA